MHYYKRNIGDYAKKCGRLSMLQHGAYTLLIDACYDREVFPTLRDAIDWTWASSKEEVEAIEFVLSRFFTVEDGVFTQKRIADELAQYHDTGLLNKRIALEREAKRRDKTTERARSVHGASPVVHEAPPNQEPLTTNHKPLTIKRETRASRLPSDFELPEMWGIFCQQLRPELDPRETFAKFKDYWTAKPGKAGTKLDWMATWRNWVREERGKPQGQKKSYAEQQRDRIAEFTGKSTIQGDANVIAIDGY